MLSAILLRVLEQQKCRRATLCCQTHRVGHIKASWEAAPPWAVGCPSRSPRELLPPPVTSVSPLTLILHVLYENVYTQPSLHLPTALADFQETFPGVAFGQTGIRKRPGSETEGPCWDDESSSSRPSLFPAQSTSTPVTTGQRGWLEGFSACPNRGYKDNRRIPRPVGSPFALCKMGLSRGGSWGVRQPLGTCWVDQRLKPRTQHTRGVANTDDAKGAGVGLG